MDNRLDLYWKSLIGYGIATDEEIQLVTSINGYKEETLNDILYCRTSFRSLEQFEDDFEAIPFC